MRPLLTIGLPVYNAMPYLPEAMESLLRQSDPRFEILAIVDGATDESLAYLRSISDPRLRVLVQENQGVTATLNRLLRECRTPWLARQDADDVSYTHRIAELLSAIDAAPQAGMFYSFADYHPRGQAKGTFRCSRGTPAELRAIVRQGYLLAICHPTVVLHVEKTRALGGYRVGLYNEDADLWWRMALAHEIHCIEKELVGFRQNESSISTRNLVEQAAGAIYVQYLLLSHLTERIPRPFAAIREYLQQFVSQSHLRSKERLRAFNIKLAEGKRWHAAAALAAAVYASPRHVAERLRDELLPGKTILNGIAPGNFYQYQEALWP